MTHAMTHGIESRRRQIRVAVGLALLALLIVGLGAAQAPAAGERKTIYMSAVEYKGGANVADEAYPPAAVEGTRALSPVGDSFGYRLKPPDGTGRWEVSSYRWEPGFLVLESGDRVRLEIAGINGAHHDGALIGPDGSVVKTFVTTRGRLTIVRFQAGQPGWWRLVCDTHPPGMTADLLVLP